jgi:hypothetical protein
MTLNQRRHLQFLLTLLAFAPYLLYVWYVITTNTAPIDYQTFMEIGQRLLTGAPIYGINSYYPMPYVMVFGVFSLLPRSFSLGLWLLIPVVLAWLISGRKAWVLLYGPLFGNFLGGQSPVFGMLGVWGYRRQPDLDRYSGGLWLALLAFKPQLAIFPTLYAAWQWGAFVRREHRIPKQALGWAGGAALYYLVGAAVGGIGWVFDWLGNPRPVGLRAQAGILPRSMIELGVQPPQTLFWIILAAGGLALFVGAWLWTRRRMGFDLWVMLSALVNPLMHDYDLIQLIPLIDTPLRRKAALLASIPLWLVILFAYQNDTAWFAVTFIPPVLAAVVLIESRRMNGRLTPDNPIKGLL